MNPSEVLPGSVDPLEVRLFQAGWYIEQSTEAKATHMFGPGTLMKHLNTSRWWQQTDYEQGRKDSAGEGECSRFGKPVARLGAVQRGVVDMEPNIGGTDLTWQERRLGKWVPEEERIAVEGIERLAG